MSTGTFPAYFMRGGTSNGLVIDRKHLPKDEKKWQTILASAMGSPDSHGRQLDGMGSGISSTSKVMVVSKSDRDDADVDYTFVQVGIKDGSLDMAGNCGNMSSAVGPFTIDAGLVDAKPSADSRVQVRMFNTNTSKVIISEFSMDENGKYEPLGDYSIDGVPGTASHIALSFLDPSGAKTGKALPTSNAVDELRSEGENTIQATLTDIANPGVFVLASDVGIPGNITSDALGAQTGVMDRLEKIRQAGAQKMGMDENIQSVPKIILLSPPNSEDSAQGINIVCRALSMGQAHKAVPLTLALNLGASCGIPGTLANLTAVNTDGKSSVVVGHASGKLEVGSITKCGKIESALLHRTARILMKGEVSYKAEE